MDELFDEEEILFFCFEEVELFAAEEVLFFSLEEFELFNADEVSFCSFEEVLFFCSVTGVSTLARFSDSYSAAALLSENKIGGKNLTEKTHTKIIAHAAADHIIL